MRLFSLLLIVFLVGCQTEVSGDPDVSSSGEQSAAIETPPTEDPAEPAVVETELAPTDQPSTSSENPATAQQSPTVIPCPDLRTRKSGDDWPTFLGPTRDSKSSEKGILTEWPAGGPPMVWMRKLGTSYDIGSISRGRYFQFDRIDDKATLFCLNSETGQELWKFDYPTEYQDILGYNNGPRCSPVVDNDRVYIHGSEGMLHCLRVADGSLIWKLDTSTKYGVVQNFFGVGSTPVIDGDLLIINVGGSPPNSPETYSGRVQGNGSGIVAFDKYTGKEKYRVTDELASYSSPIVTTMGSQRWAFSFARGGLIGFDPASGKQRFHYPWRSRSLESVNAATPIVFGNHIFISETYSIGSSLLKITDQGHEIVWTDADRGRDKSMLCHWNTPIYHEGYIYGSSGRHKANAELRCIRAEDGEVQWSEPGLTRSSLLYVDGHLLCLSENGALRLLKANPEKFDLLTGVILKDKEVGQLLDDPAWAAPILSHGLLYLRGKSHLVCLELIPK